LPLATWNKGPPSHRSPTRQLESLTAAYAGYCQRFPAFLDCALALMRRPARELRETVSESVWLRLGMGMARCLGCLQAVLRAGKDRGEFDLSDPDYTANVLWTQGLGLMHLSRIRVGLRGTGSGVPDLFSVTPEQVVATCVESALATVRATSS
jgi:hypothetical protein